MKNNPYESPKSDVGRESKILGDLKPTSKSLFKLIFFGLLFSLGPLFIANGIYALLTGSESFVQLNGKNLVGLPGFIGVIVFTPLFILIFSSIIWLFVNIGLWAYTLKWKLNLEFKE